MAAAITASPSMAMGNPHQARKTLISPSSISMIRRNNVPSPSILRCSASSFLGFALNFSSIEQISSTRKLKSRRSRQVIVMGYDVGIGIMGTKLGMMSYFRSDGEHVPVTVIGFKKGNIVTQVKLEATHGYNSVQVGYHQVPPRKLAKPQLGHLCKAGAVPLRHLQEFRLPSYLVKQYHPGQQLVLMELFNEGDKVDISGITIGKGFQGVIKRHNFRSGPSSHGSKHHRRVGSIGSGCGRVFPGKKMPGRMGCDKRTMKALEIVKIDVEHRVMLVKGGVPGKHGNLLRITPTKVGRHPIPTD